MNTLSRCIQYDGGRMDEKILAYRSELQKRSENTPFWTRTILTVEEAARIHRNRKGKNPSNHITRELPFHGK